MRAVGTQSRTARRRAGNGWWRAASCSPVAATSRRNYHELSDRGLFPEPFRHLFGLCEAELTQHGAIRYVADKSPGFPCRVELRDGLPGETFLLLHHEHQPAPTPYRASHAIFVCEGATTAYEEVGRVPDVMRCRLLSLRAFDGRGMMLDADVVDGREVEPVIEQLFTDSAVRTIDVHYAKRGCFSGRIERAD